MKLLKPIWAVCLVDWRELDTGTVEQLREKYASWNWTYGRTPRLTSADASVYLAR